MPNSSGFDYDDSRRLLDVILIGGPPWGFTLTGGSEFGSRLYVKKVSDPSKAIADCLFVGDEILSVNGVSCTSRETAIQMIRSVEDELRLKICRWTSNSPTSPRRNSDNTEAFYTNMVDSIVSNMNDMSNSSASTSTIVAGTPVAHAGNSETGRYKVTTSSKGNTSDQQKIRLAMSPSQSPPLKAGPRPHRTERSVDEEPDELFRSSSDGGHRKAKAEVQSISTASTHQAISSSKSVAQKARAYQKIARRHSQDASSLLGNGAVEPADRPEHVVKVSTARAFFESASLSNESPAATLKSWKSGPVLVTSRDISPPEQHSVRKDLRRTQHDALHVPKHEHSRSLPVEDYANVSHVEVNRPASVSNRGRRGSKDIERPKSAYSVDELRQRSIDDADDEDGSSCGSPPAAPPRYSHSDLLRSFRTKGSYGYDKVMSSFSSEDLRFVHDDVSKSRTSLLDKPLNSADELRLAATRYHKELLRNYPGVRHSLTGKDPLQKLPRKVSVPAEEGFSRNDLVRATVGGTGPSRIPRSQSANESSHFSQVPEALPPLSLENSIMTRLLREQSNAALMKIEEEAASKSRRKISEASDESEHAEAFEVEAARDYDVELKSEDFRALPDSADLLQQREVKSKALSSPKQLTDIDRTVNVPSSLSSTSDACHAVPCNPVPSSRVPSSFSAPSVAEADVPQSSSSLSGELLPPVPTKSESPVQSSSPKPGDRGPKSRLMPLKTEARVGNSYFVPLKADSEEPRSVALHANQNPQHPSSIRGFASTEVSDRKFVDDKQTRSVKQKSLDFETMKVRGGDQGVKRTFVRQKSVDSVLDAEDSRQPRTSLYSNTRSAMAGELYQDMGLENGQRLVSTATWQSAKTVAGRKTSELGSSHEFACVPYEVTQESHANDAISDSVRERSESPPAATDVGPRDLGVEDLTSLPPPPDELLADDNDVANDEVDGEVDQTAEREKPQRTINRRKKDLAVGSRNNSCVSTDSTTSTGTADSGIGLRSESSPRTSPGIGADYCYDGIAVCKGSKEVLDDDEGMIEESSDRVKDVKVAAHQLMHQSSVDSEEVRSPASSASSSRPDSLVFASRKEDLDAEKLRLIESMRDKIRELTLQESEIADEIKVNEELGARVLRMVEAKTTQTEFAKYELFIGELNKIVALLLSLTQRLHRYELMLQELDMSNAEDKAKRDELVSKIDKLKSQHEEACYLREVNDKRGENVATFLEKYCSEEEFADFQYYVDMKSQLALMRSEISEKVKLGEERLKALESTGTDW